MKAIFPDAKSLQPMPTPYVHANISGNTNSALPVAGNGPQNANMMNTVNNAPVTQSNNAKNGGLIPIICLVGLLIILIIYFIYKKLKRKKSVDASQNRIQG